MYKKKHIRLLVVDEQSSYYELIHEQAEFCSHDVDLKCAFTASGTEAMKLITSWEPSVILLNAHIADADSFEIVERCRETFVQVIVTSDMPSLEIEKTARSRGATAYVVKSEDPDEVEMLISEICTRSTGVSEARH